MLDTFQSGMILAARPHPAELCPGSVYTPTKDGLCLCGYSRESHALEHDGHGGFLPIDQVAADDAPAELENDRPDVDYNDRDYCDRERDT